MNTEKTVLIIDDDTDLIEALKHMLKPLGCRVMEASSPSEGFSKAKNTPPDLIILDVMFGSKAESKGFELATQFKGEKSLAAVPILMFTAINTTLSDFKFSPETDGEYLPVDEFMEKPAKPQEFREKVERLLNQKVSRWASWPENPKI